jgi:predicted small lipoprotein YifL
VNGRVLPPLLALATALAGCGLKGPLYLPEKSREVVIRPAPAEAATPPAAPPESGPATGTSAQPEPPAEREAPTPPGSSNG